MHSFEPDSVRHPLDTRVELRQLRVQLGEDLPGKDGQSRRRVIQKTDDGGPNLLWGWRQSPIHTRLTSHESE